MTKGHGTCGQPIVGRKRPQRGRTTSSLAPVRPPSGTIESMSAIRRFHSLRSFHPRLFTFAPFGDGRMLLAKLQLKHHKAPILYLILRFLRYHQHMAFVAQCGGEDIGFSTILQLQSLAQFCYGKREVAGSDVRLGDS